jgi:hypothetical protein
MDRTADGIAALVAEGEEFLAGLGPEHAALTAKFSARLEALRAGERPTYDEQSRALMRLQSDRCAVCGRLERSAPFVLDHDHETAFSRGMLCRSCNIQEGRSDHEDFERYRADHPAVGFGWTYQDYFGRWAVPVPPETEEEEDARLERHATFRLAEYLAEG